MAEDRKDDALQQALRTTRLMLELGHPIDKILDSDFVPSDLKDAVRRHIARDANFVLVAPKVLVADNKRPDWLNAVDRSNWYYWPTLRQHLLGSKGWDLATLRSLDDASDRILKQLAPPTTDKFDVRGLVLGFVQSGKTANYTALIAKAADAGYRFVIVLTGTDNGLRRQTQLRLKRELTGYADNRSASVPLPPDGMQWHEFTRDDVNGDFDGRYYSHSALQAGQPPVIAVMKKHGGRLRQLLECINNSPQSLRNDVPVLVIDDEADLASIDTRGSYQNEDGPPEDDYEPPSTINGLIRDLLSKFQRCAYVAYTATPFANILVPHDTIDPDVGNDLYPKDFIVDLPKPKGYFGAEEIFGVMDSGSSTNPGGLDVVRRFPTQDCVLLEQGQLPDSLRQAIADFVLAGAARAQRGQDSEPSTMLVHTSHLILAQGHVSSLVKDFFAELRDEWRYHRVVELRAKFQERWELAFRPTTGGISPEYDTKFEDIEPHIGPFMEAVRVREINSATGEFLDYEREPSLKVIAVGGNRLSRGLTLEGLIVSYFSRRSPTYDTLMQMGRWFGFRAGYVDLTRIWTTEELSDWFSDLAFVEHRLREDMQVYEEQGITPYELGMRIWQHPTMQVTSPLKRRFASNTQISQSYSDGLQQTFKFPLDDPEKLVLECENNRIAVIDLVSSIPPKASLVTDNQGPIWSDVPAAVILDFLGNYRNSTASISLPLMIEYIERSIEKGELVKWIVAVRGRGKTDKILGTTDWGLPSGPVSQISRSKLKSHRQSLGVITDPEDEAIGLDTRNKGKDARSKRSADTGLLLLYPISKYSGQGLPEGSNREAIFAKPEGPASRDVVGLAVSFPKSGVKQKVEAYLSGTAGWRPVE